MKLVVFALPNDINVNELARRLDSMFGRMNVKSTVTILEEKDLSFDKAERPHQCQIIDDIVKMCGNPINRLQFTSAFYQGLTSCFNHEDVKDAKIILNELLKGQSIPAVEDYARSKEVFFIFDLARNALGMLR